MIGSFRFNAGKPDHLGPLFRVVSDELGEFSRAAAMDYRTHIGEPCPELGVGKRGVNLLVELFNNLGGCTTRSTYAVP